MLLRLFLLFSLIPLVEVVLLAWIAQHTNWMVTLALIFVPGLLVRVAGALTKGFAACGKSATRSVKESFRPAPLLDGLLILVAAVLLITPGVLTDVVGFALLLPPVRHAVRRGLSRRLRMRRDGRCRPSLGARCTAGSSHRR